MSGPPPKKPEDRVRRNKPASGEWKEAPGVGWQHGRKPAVPKELTLTPEAQDAWRAWFASWWASNWTQEDLPGLKLVIRKYDEVLRGSLDIAKVTPLLDAYGITPKGRQSLHWSEPKKTNPAPATAGATAGNVTQMRPRVTA